MSDGGCISQAIAEATTDRYLGTVEVRRCADSMGVIRYGVIAAERGRGVATAAVRLLLEQAFDPAQLDLGVVLWCCPIGNWAARRVAWHCGFTIHTTPLRGGAGHDITRHPIDSWIGSLLRTDPGVPAHPWYSVPTLIGNAVRLRAWGQQDAPACVEAATDPAMRQWVSAADRYDLDDARASIESRHEQAASGRGICWAITAGEQAIGAISLHKINPDLHSADLAYWLHPAARRRGLALDAIRAVQRWAYGAPLALQRLTLSSASNNQSSIRLAGRAGFVQVGCLTAAKRLGDGTVTDLLVYELRRDTTPYPAES